MTTMTLKDLAIDHPYYASGSNYYSNDAGKSWGSWPEFYSEFKNADIDMNLVYRFDILLIDEEKGHCDGNYAMQVTIIGQRKGLYIPHIIQRVFEIDVPEIVSYLNPHFERILEIWRPLSSKR